MPDYASLVGAIKKAGVEAVKAGDPADISYGNVLSVNPLQIQVDQKLTLGMESLILARNVTDYETSLNISWETEEKSGGSGEEAFSSHKHTVSGTKTVKVLNALKTGEKVILIKLQGGQQYVVIDRVGKTP